MADRDQFVAAPASDAAIGRNAIWRAFSNRNYALFASGNAISLIGFWVQRLAVGWLAWDLTHSGFWLGAVAFADLFPVMLVGPIGGVLADRMDKVRLIFVCQTLAAIQAAVLAWLVMTGRIDIVSLLLLTVIGGSLVGLNQPARLSLIPRLVRGEDLATAISLNSIIFNLSRFIGPALAGVLLTTVGTASCFAFNAISYFALLLALLLIRLGRAPAAPPRRGSVLSCISEGIAYAWQHKGIGPLLLALIAGAVFARPLIDLLPGLTEILYQRGAAGLAGLTAATGAGAIAGGLWLAYRGRFTGLTRIVVSCALVYGVTIPAFVATSNYFVGLAVLVVVGFVMAVSEIGTQTLIQASVDESLRGRVLSLYGLIFRGGPALGAVVMGGLGDLVGLRWPVAAGGVLALLVLAWVAQRRHSIATATESLQTSH